MRELLKRRGLRADSLLMVGDRRHDVRAARENGLRSAGVTYGYGTEAELKEAGAEHLVGSPDAAEALIKAL